VIPVELQQRGFTDRTDTAQTTHEKNDNNNTNMNNKDYIINPDAQRYTRDEIDAMAKESDERIKCCVAENDMFVLAKDTTPTEPRTEPQPTPVKDLTLDSPFEFEFDDGVHTMTLREAYALVQRAWSEADAAVVQARKKHRVTWHDEFIAKVPMPDEVVEAQRKADEIEQGLGAVTELIMARVPGYGKDDDEAWDALVNEATGHA
jgi:hypothetical protein